MYEAAIEILRGAGGLLVACAVIGRDRAGRHGRNND